MKTLNLGAVGGGKKAASKSSYPVVPDPNGDVAKMVSEVIKLTAEKKAIEGGLKLAKGEVGGSDGLVPLARKFFLDSTSGKADVPSSVEAVCDDGSVLVIMQNRYKACEDEAALAAVIGKANVNRYFYSRFKVEVDGDKVPEAVAQTLIDEMAALFAKHGCTDALSAKSVTIPKPEFHESRHTVLTKDQNAKVDELCPPVVAVKERKES
jgi:hypothetical protein